MKLKPNSNPLKNCRDCLMAKDFAKRDSLRTVRAENLWEEKSLVMEEVDLKPPSSITKPWKMKPEVAAPGC
jgi:hypothetical protein